VLRVALRYRHYYEGTTAIIFVIDASEKWRTEDLDIELNTKASEEPLKSVPILMFANKQDHKDAITVDEL
jgi:signal recognition particle receptor subunit beta